jgi:hypothetical protein
MTQCSKHVALYKGKYLFYNKMAVLTKFVVTTDFTEQDVFSKYYKHIFWTNEFVTHFLPFTCNSFTSLEFVKFLYLNIRILWRNSFAMQGTAHLFSDSTEICCNGRATHKPNYPSLRLLKDASG